VAGHHTGEAALDAKPHITCRQLIDFIMSYQENELPAGERTAFERHLAACPPCQAYLDSYDKTVHLARQSAGDDPAPAEVPESLIAAILAARNARE
jgi:anti-sigma factor RsiW